MREKLQLWGITAFFLSILIYTTVSMYLNP
jgi:hypothetical protein